MKLISLSPCGNHRCNHKCHRCTQRSLGVALFLLFVSSFQLDLYVSVQTDQLPGFYVPVQTSQLHLHESSQTCLHGCQTVQDCTLVVELMPLALMFDLGVLL